MVGLLQSCVDRGRGVGHSHQVLGGRIGHHLLAVIIELGGGPIGGHDYPKLVWPLKNNLGFCGESEWMTMTARALIKMHRVEFHCPRRGEPAACRFKNVECLWFKRRCGFRCRTCL